MPRVIQLKAAALAAPAVVTMSESTTTLVVSTENVESAVQMEVESSTSAPTQLPASDAFEFAFEDPPVVSVPKKNIKPSPMQMEVTPEKHGGPSQSSFSTPPSSPVLVSCLSQESPTRTVEVGSPSAATTTPDNANGDRSPVFAVNNTATIPSPELSDASATPEPAAEPPVSVPATGSDSVNVDAVAEPPLLNKRKRGSRAVARLLHEATQFRAGDAKWGDPAEMLDVVNKSVVVSPQTTRGKKRKQSVTRPVTAPAAEAESAEVSVPSSATPVTPRRSSHASHMAATPARSSAAFNAALLLSASSRARLLSLPQSSLSALSLAPKTGNAAATENSKQGAQSSGTVPATPPRVPTGCRTPGSSARRVPVSAAQFFSLGDAVLVVSLPQSEEKGGPCALAALPKPLHGRITRAPLQSVNQIKKKLPKAQAMQRLKKVHVCYQDAEGATRNALLPMECLKKRNSGIEVNLEATTTPAAVPVSVTTVPVLNQPALLFRDPILPQRNRAAAVPPAIRPNADMEMLRSDSLPATSAPTPSAEAPPPSKRARVSAPMPLVHSTPATENWLQFQPGASSEVLRTKLATLGTVDQLKDFATALIQEIERTRAK
jgi:hypothetical protein